MVLISVRDDLVKRLMEVSSSLGKSISDYVNEVFEQAVRAHELKCGLKETVDVYEKTIIKKGGAEEADRLEEPSTEEIFQRAALRLRPEIGESDERKMLIGFLCELSETQCT